MTVKNSQYLPVVKKTSEGTTATTTLNGRSFVIESQLTTPAEPNGKPSEPQPTTTPPIPLGQYSMITTIPEPTSEVFGSYSDSQDELEQSPVPQPPEVPQETRKPNGQQQYSEHTTGFIGAYCVVQTVEENPTPEPSRTVAQKPPQGNQQKVTVSTNACFPNCWKVKWVVSKSCMHLFTNMWVDFLVSSMQATILCPPLYTFSTATPFPKQNCSVYSEILWKSFSLTIHSSQNGCLHSRDLLKGMCSRWLQPSVIHFNLRKSACMFISGPFKFVVQVSRYVCTCKCTIMLMWLQPMLFPRVCCMQKWV